MSKQKKSRLGRGLSSLMAVSVSPPAGGGEKESSTAVVTPVEAAAEYPAMGGSPQADASPLAWIAIDSIQPNPFQPRRDFDPAALQQLAGSIEREGVMQPIVVRLANSADTTSTKYELVAGERRWRAAQIAGLKVIPAMVKDLSDRQIAEWAIIENLQREDLNPMERAEAFARLKDQFQLTHEQIADRVGVDRSTMTNLLRLLDLCHSVQELVRKGQLSNGHGRSLLGISDPALQLAVATQAVKGGWSVRQIEAQVKKILAEPSARQAASQTRSAHLVDLEQQLSTQLQTKVQIKSGRKKNAGTLMIDYYDLDQFDALVSRLGIAIE